MKDTMNKNSQNQAFEFIKKNIRYFTAGALFLILLLVLIKFTGPAKPDDGLAIASTQTEDVQEEPYQVNANQEINNLVTQYYTAYASGDIDTLASIAAPVSANEQSYISLFSQYVEEYRNVACYTKTGLDSNSYLVSVSMEIKFADVDTTAPGLDFFYIRTNEEGSLYIDNLYSQYNLANQENALDTSVLNLITGFENARDVRALQQEIQGKYDAAIEADANLAAMISTTIPGAIAEWVATVTNQTPEEVAENTETPTEIPEETQEEMPEETPAEQPPASSETVYATDRVNVRAAADTESDRIGAVDQGASLTRTGTEGEWSAVDYNGTTGYIKSEYLTADASSITSADEGDSSSDHTSGGSIAEGTVITLTNTTNIRESMSETADKVGTAYQGEKVTVVMSYAEGWTKVTWNNKTGYIKTSLLQ